jgi:hypothetical protein
VTPRRRLVATCAIAAIVVSIAPPAGRASGSPPVARSMHLDVVLGEQRTIRLFASDPEGDPLTYSIVPSSGPNRGTLTGTPPNLTYTASTTESFGDGFRFTVTDGSSTVEAAVTIDVRPPGLPPTLTADSFAVPESAISVLDLLANDVDPEGKPLRLVLVQDPLGDGTHPVIDGRFIRFMPSPFDEQPRQLFYIVQDADGWTSSSFAYVTAVADPPGHVVPAGTITPLLVPRSSPAGSYALVNLAAVDASAPGYLTADACSTLGPGPQTTANVNYPARGAVSNLGLVPVDADGRACIFNSTGTELVADVIGRLHPEAPFVDGWRLTPGVPRRVLDTRADLGGRLLPGSFIHVDSGSTAEALLVNVSMVDALEPGYVTVERCSFNRAGPRSFSSGNYVAGVTSSNLAIASLSNDGAFCIYNHSAVHVVIDVVGSFSREDGSKFAPLAKRRVLDTRDRGAPVDASSITRVSTGAPPGTTAVVVNLATLDGEGAGYVTADRCSALVAGPQATATTTHPATSPTSNLAVVAVDADGSFCIYNQRAVHLVVDVQGAFGASGTHVFSPGGRRLIDTR